MQHRSAVVAFELHALELLSSELTALGAAQ